MHARRVLRLDELPELAQELVLRCLCERADVPGAVAALRALARVSRRWRALAEPRWARLYERLGPHGPERERAMSRHGLGAERRVELLTGVGCQLCGLARVTKVHWPFPVRACRGCIQAVTTSGHVLRESFGVPRAALAALPSTSVQLWSGRGAFWVDFYFDCDVRRLLGCSPSAHAAARREAAVADVVRAAGGSTAALAPAELERRAPSLAALGGSDAPFREHARLAAAAAAELRTWAAAERAAELLGLPGAAGRSPGARVRAALPRSAALAAFVGGCGGDGAAAPPDALALALALARAVVRGELRAAAAAASALRVGQVLGACDGAALRAAAARPRDAGAAEAALAQAHAAACIAGAVVGALRHAALPPELALATRWNDRTHTHAARRASDALSWHARGSAAAEATAELHGAWRRGEVDLSLELGDRAAAVAARQLEQACAWARLHVVLAEAVRHAAETAPHGTPPAYRAALLEAVEADALRRTLCGGCDPPPADLGACRAAATEAAARVPVPQPPHPHPHTKQYRCGRCRSDRLFSSEGIAAHSKAVHNGLPVLQTTHAPNA
jgi:hypothetical protein